MTLLPWSSLLLPSPLGVSSFRSSAPLPSLCPNPMGSTLLTYHLVHRCTDEGTWAFISVQQVGRQKENASLLCLHGGRKGRAALFLTQAGCQLCREMVRAVASCWGWLALKPTMSHKNKRPAVPAPRWLGSWCAQVCTDVFSWQVQPTQAWLV